MTITLDDLKTAKLHRGAHLDCAGYSQNLFSCPEHPRLTATDTFPRGKGAKNIKFGRTYFVDCTPCADLEEVVARLNATPGAPLCGTCKTGARLTDGKEVYPYRLDLHDRPIWKCDGCGGYVGCHPGTTKPLGTPADAALRKARGTLHDQRFDPIWKTADSCGLYTPEDNRARWTIRRRARDRLYQWLAAELDIPVERCHIGMFDLETCRRAWSALHGITYPQIREWALAKGKSKRRAA
jgi:hypothetical protein